MTKKQILDVLNRVERKTILSFVAAYAAEDNHFYEKLKEALNDV